MQTKINSIINASIQVKKDIIEKGELSATLEKVIGVITKAFQNGNSVYFAGNGGSAADAQHLAAEFSGRFYKDRKALPSEALHCNTSYLTAVANDYSYEIIYSRLIEGLAKPGDVLFCISGSGNSKNIKEALMLGKILQMKTVLITRTSTGTCRSFADVVIEITGESQFPGQTGGNNNNFHFEDSISKISHMLTGVLKANVK
jgi:D-sedoheptulose 7-phosphate isomerase